MSCRTLSRRFREHVGMTPAAWIARARVREAQRLLETTRLSVEAVAEAAGYGSATVLRDRFAAIVGVSPLAYRRSFSSVRQPVGSLARAQGRARLVDADTIRPRVFARQGEPIPAIPNGRRRA